MLLLLALAVITLSLQSLITELPFSYRIKHPYTLVILGTKNVGAARTWRFAILGSI